MCNCNCRIPAYNQLEQMINDLIAKRILELKDLSDSTAQNALLVSQMAEEMKDVLNAGSQWTLDQQTTEGIVIDLPETDKDITLNLISVSPLSKVTVRLPDNQDGRIGQRVFINSNNQIDEVDFVSTNHVNNASVMFSMGDNFVYYRNQPNIWSRITS